MAKLYFRYGAVGSAKTLNLLAVAHNYQQQNKLVAITKPCIDTRFGQDFVKSRAELSKQVTFIIDDSTVLNPDHFRNIHCLVVDEAQFLHPKHIEMLRMIADEANCPVICYGLRTDFRRELFPGSKRLIELADSIEEVKTTCHFCNRKAIFNLKLLTHPDGKISGTTLGEQIQLGCEETYVPTCSFHYNDYTKHENSAPVGDAAPQTTQESGDMTSAAGLLVNDNLDAEVQLSKVLYRQDQVSNNREAIDQLRQNLLTDNPDNYTIPSSSSNDSK